MRKNCADKYNAQIVAFGYVRVNWICFAVQGRCEDIGYYALHFFPIAVPCPLHGAVSGMLFANLTIP